MSVHNLDEIESYEYAEGDEYEDDYYLDEYAHYDPDRDEMVDPDDEGDDDDLDYDVDLDDKDDWS